MWSNISAPRSLKASTLRDHLKASENNKESPSSSSEIETGFYPSEQQQDAKLSGSPLMRYKHAVCSSPNGYIYIHGGRHGNLPLDDDVWRFDPHQNSWLQLNTKGCKPPSLQEHTLVEHNEQLYLFGGQVSASNNDDSFWRLDLVNNEWHSLSMRSSKFGAHLGPTNRRGHTANIYGDSMYVFGGFEDFRGSSAQLWEYNLLNQRWELRNLSSTSACHPEPRHSHSAIVYDHSMYVFGGLSNLKPLSDLWRWSWRDKRWFKERIKGKSPGQLHGHTAIQAFGSMFVFGGERNGRTTRSLWRLNLSTLTWQKIRPKGPRPSPTTFHAAIANPLSILDETNYIIEGDHELLRGNGISFSIDNCLVINGSEEMGCPIKTELIDQVVSGSLTHSQSTNANIGTRSSIVSSSHQRATKRRSRLSFLRRNRLERPKSTCELKQLPSSVSANNILSGGASSIKASNRHSVSIAPTTKFETKTNHNVSQEANTTILDNLDQDIKQMFQQAMDEPVEDRDLDSMIVDDEIEPANSSSNNRFSQQSRSTICTGTSQYQTAIQANSSQVTLVNGNQNIPMSQRTSYAFTTPPSELSNSRSNQKNSSNDVHDDRRTWLALNNAPFASGYDRRDNRPKSEIVQSLIERADARIKHLYLPYFNQHSNEKRHSETKHGGRHHHENRLLGNDKPQNLDKSKRHTIHQTMTYYNLYFSEDKSSSSPSSDNQQVAETSNNVNRAPEDLDEIHDDQTISFGKMVRDDMSSSTIKGSSDRANGILVGIHGSGPSLCSQIEHQLRSQVSSESDSRTICGDLNHTGSSDPSTVFGNSNSVGGQTENTHVSSLTNALTANNRRDTAAESCSDNTSLSFSVIAEFEEDDMLQYSSPTDPIIINSKRVSPVHGYSRNENQVLDMESDQDRRETIDKIKPEEIKPQKSSSSGYDSISGSENHHQVNNSVSHNTDSRSIEQAMGSSSDQRPQPSQSVYLGQQNSASDGTQEDSSVRTESSLGFTTNIETSPEQSATKNQHKKMKGRNSLYRRARNQLKMTNSSTTADSLALASEVADSMTYAAPSKSLPSSPPENRARPETSDNLQTQSKMPLMSRAKFFGKHKSKNRYWQLCMFVIGGKQHASNGVNEPITIWRLYI